MSESRIMRIFGGGNPQRSPADDDSDAFCARSEFGALSGNCGHVVNAVVLVLSLVLIFLIASWYKRRVTDQRRPFPDPVPEQWNLANGKGFAKGTFNLDCCACCFGCFCSACRVADTYQMTYAAGFWPVVLFFMASHVASRVAEFAFIAAGLHFGGQRWGVANLVSHVIIVCYVAAKRQQLRRRLGGESTFGTCVGDFCCFCWCFPCTVIQDAQQVDGASGEQLAGGCSFALAATAAPGWPAASVVGQPVGVGGVAQPVK